MVLRVLCMLVVFALFCGSAFAVLFTNNGSFEITFYQYNTEKLPSSLRIVALSDLHKASFGRDNARLIEAVAALKPDMIALIGDMVDKSAASSAPLASLLERLMDIAPVYYALGNHEMSRILDKNEQLKTLISDTGAVLLHNTIERVTVKDCEFNIGGLSYSGAAIQKYAPGFMEELNACEGFTLLLTHYPENFINNGIQDNPIDLAICGHAHGGLIRLPVVGGLYSPDQGLLPDLVEGIHERGQATVAVSRGLGTSSRFPRINNKPEVVVIDIHAGIIQAD